MADFSFKQFTIKQDACAMKVSLDACLFGALCAHSLKHDSHTQKILDIGAGTGLLSLMLAQAVSDVNIDGAKMNAVTIDAIEIDDSAFKQAAENIQASPFSHTIRLHHLAVQDFSSSQQYHQIICNPPFFTEQLKSPNAQRNLARHNESLSFYDLCQAIKENLAPNGKAWILLPINELQGFEQAMKAHGLAYLEMWQVISRRNKPCKVCIFTLTQEGQAHEGQIANTHSTANSIPLHHQHKLTVYQDNNQYTEQFRGLLTDYYLKL